MTEEMKEEESLKNWKITDCRLREEPLAIWNQSTWDSVKDAYRRAVGMEHSSFAGTDSVSSMHVPYEVRWLEKYKTRSVFVTERVEKGQLVWKPTPRVKFVEEAAFRRFLSSLSYDMACDILSSWAYVVEDDEYGLACVVELDDSVYMSIDDDSSFTYNGTGVFASDTVEAGTEIEFNDEVDNVVADYYLNWFTYLKEEANSIGNQNDIDILVKMNMTNCHLHERSLPTWDNETWKSLQDLYRHVVGVENSTIPLDSESGMLVPYKVRPGQQGYYNYDGVFLTEPVKKGQKVWSPSHTAKFVTEASFQQFLSSMSDDMSCLILLNLLYVIEDDESHFVYFVDLDVANYMSPDNVNASFVATLTGVFAVHDVDAGESIMADYSEFNKYVDQHTIKWLSDLKRAALSPIVAGCAGGANKNTIWDQDTWEELRNKYRHAVGVKLSSLSTDTKKSGMLVPYEVRKDPIKGRGVYLTEKVKKGQLVWDTSQHAKFAKEIPFHRFLSSISHDLACDVLQWAYVVEDPIYGPVCAFELDDGTYMNNGGIASPFDFSKDGVFALRDVEAGEEIVVNYDVVVEGTGFLSDGDNPWFYKVKTNAWGYINDGVGVEYEMEPDGIEAKSSGLESILPFGISFLSLLLLIHIIRLRRHAVETPKSTKEKIA